MDLNVDHSKVLMTIMNMTPTRAATGMAMMTFDPNMMRTSSVSAPTIPEVLPRPPFFMLMSDWPMVAQPPIPPNIPDAMLAAP